MANAPKKGAALKAAPAVAPLKAVSEAVNAVESAEAQLAAPAEEIQESLRSALEKGVVESRAAFTKAKIAADETANAMEVSFAAAKDGALAINAKAFEALRAHADASFDFLKAAFAVKSLPDLVTLQTEFARKQVETITSQTKDFGALAQKAVADAVEPLKQQAARSFKLAV